jgi:preprotein translocase subunit SecG
MDTTIIFTLVLSALFVGGIIWIVVHSRHQRSAEQQAQRTASPEVKSDVRGSHAGGREKR